MKKKLCVTVSLLIVVTVTVYATFFQGFEANTDGWSGANRVATGTHGFPRKRGFTTPRTPESPRNEWRCVHLLGWLQQDVPDWWIYDLD